MQYRDSRNERCLNDLFHALACNKKTAEMGGTCGRSYQTELKSCKRFLSSLEGNTRCMEKSISETKVQSHLHEETIFLSILLQRLPLFLTLSHLGSELFSLYSRFLFFCSSLR